MGFERGLKFSGFILFYCYLNDLDCAFNCFVRLDFYCIDCKLPCGGYLARKGAILHVINK